MKFRVVLIATLSVGMMFGLPNTVSAAPAKGKVLTACKQKIKDVFGEDIRTKLHRYRSSGVTFKVRTPERSHTIRCVFDDDQAALFKNEQPLGPPPKDTQRS